MTESRASALKRLAAAVIVFLAAPQCHRAPPSRPPERVGPAPPAVSVPRPVAPRPPWVVVEQADLSARLEAARDLEVENLGTAINATRRAELMWVPNADGSHDILQWYTQGNESSVVIADLGSGEHRRVDIPHERFLRSPGLSAATVVGPKGRLYIGTTSQRGIELFVYDPSSNQLENRGAIVPDLNVGRVSFALGTDGMIYGTGTAKDLGKPKLFRLHPKTGAVKVLGVVGPSHLPYQGHGGSIAACGDDVYVASGRVPWFVVRWQKSTGKQTVLLKTARVGSHARVLRRGATCFARVRPGTLSGESRAGAPDEVYRLEAGKPVSTEASAVPAQNTTRPRVRVDRADAHSGGAAEISYLPRGAKEDAPWSVLKFSVPTAPARILRIAALSDGRLFGTVENYQGAFLWDPRSSRVERLGTMPLSHYSTVVHGDTAYLSGYPNAAVLAFDPSQPWTVTRGAVRGGSPDLPGANPRRLSYLKEHTGAHKMFCGVKLGARIYFGGMWVRHGNGGALGWWDLGQGAAGGVWKPFVNRRIEHMAALERPNLLVLSTSNTVDVTRRSKKPAEASVLFFDVEKKEIVASVTPVSGAKRTGPIVALGNEKLMGITRDPKAPRRAAVLYGIDAVVRKLAWQVQLPSAIRLHPRQLEFDFVVGPDGRVWTFLDNRLVAIAPDDARIEVLGVVRRPGRIAFVGEDLYIAGEADLRRVAGVATAAPVGASNPPSR